MTIRVVWEKDEGKFHYLLIGDCACAEIPLRGGGGRKVRLAKWSVSGTGGAAWVGEAAERRRAGNAVPQSSIRGRPLVRSIDVRAICCSDADTPRTTPGFDPWDFTEEADDSRPRTGGGRASDERPVTGTGTPSTESEDEAAEPDAGESRPRTLEEALAGC